MEWEIVEIKLIYTIQR